ncbi:MAG: hypothetical protein EOO05_00640 [Chitinophagaceae bacterium]|nr:MAG: hypothetical protein EOO05_00640 [Chitinophagaceae bacterium]
MKLTSLLIQYLYANQRLDLPGIGTFSLDRSVIAQFDNPKNRLPVTEGISFQSKPNLSESPDLISFISAETGKMKSLASADLDSRIELAKQFLNLGKPFTFEGLGTLVRRVTGEVEFTPAFIIPDGTRTVPSTGGFQEREEQPKKYESFLTEPKKSGTVPKPVLAGLVVGGIVLAIAAGYFISRSGRTNNTEATAAVITTTPDTPVGTPTDTANTAITAAPGTTATTTPVVPVSAAATPPSVASGDNYKYVLEVAKGTRAFKRFNQLRTNLWKVELETKDSIDYKLFLMLPAINADTTRIVDSLTVMLGRKVYIEHQN